MPSALATSGAGKVRSCGRTELNLSNELSYDAAGEMACNCFNEFDEINMVISFIRDSADHNNRYIALVTNLSHRCAFHFYTQCVWQICFESVSQRGVRDKLVTSHDQPSLNLWLRYSKLVEDSIVSSLLVPR